MQFVSFWFVRAFFELFRLIPFALLYKISDGLARGLFIFGYRKTVIYNNLRRCFPEKNDAEISEIVKGAYRNLADVTLESVKGNVTNPAELSRRFTYPNPETLNALLQKGRSIVLVGPHYNNWEWLVLTLPPALCGHTIAIYKPLSNPRMDKWLYNRRMRAGAKMCSMKETLVAMQQYQPEPGVYILVSDQSPSNRRTAHWVDFFGQNTACLPGADLLSRKYNYPVFAFDIQRTARGFYKMSFHEVCPEPLQAPPQAITQLFMKKFEETIRRRPENWLWSHRRWKMS